MDEMPPMAASPFRFGNSPCDAAACTSDSIARAGLPRADGGCDGGNDSADAQSEELVSMEIQQEPGSPSAVSDCSSIGSMVDELLDLEFVSRTVMASVDGACIDVSAPSVEIGSCMPVAHDNCEPHMAEDEIGTAVEEGAQEQLTRVRRRSSLVSDHVPLWGCVSICGRRQEMEDAATALTRYLEVPLHMLGSQGRLTSGTNQGQGSSCLSHFFGVYDGHGGAKVANYCKERVHRALIEEMRNLPQVQGTSSDNLLKQWERIFINCFNKVDAEVAGERATASDDGSAGTFEAIAPETVGSTAVVSVVSPTHIIVANCGDSRAVLYRGKQPMPLSVDHKPNREDEYARIEAAGGKVIQWNGYRVLGVLAMSRSIDQWNLLINLQGL